MPIEPHRTTSIHSIQQQQQQEIKDRVWFLSALFYEIYSYLINFFV